MKKRGLAAPPPLMIEKVIQSGPKCLQSSGGVGVGRQPPPPDDLKSGSIRAKKSTKQRGGKHKLSLHGDEAKD